MRKHLLLFLFFSVLVLSLFSAIASNVYLPNGDYHMHVAGINQAAYALQEGQFPLRTAPTSHHGWRYPIFQFYAPVPYGLAGALVAYLHLNAWVTYKLLLWTMLVIGGIYCYRLIRWLTTQATIGLLCASAYLLAPYLLININVRGDFTETFAQGLLPVTLFYALRLFFMPNTRTFLLTALGFSLLAMSHLITFAYGSLFLFALLFIVSCLHRQYGYAFLRLVAASVYGILLSTWFLAPILLTTGLHIHKELFYPSLFNFLTPLSGLFSFVSVSPMPLPGNHGLTTPLYPALGWPLLLGVGVALYAASHKITHEKNPLDLLFYPLLFLFFIALLLTWSPVNFWRYLPHFFSVAQFSYRFLAQCTWIGMLLLAWSLRFLFQPQVNHRQVVIGLALLVALSGSWIHTQISTMTIHAPVLVNDSDTNNYDTYDYQETAELLTKHHYLGTEELPMVTGDHWLMLNTPWRIPAAELHQLVRPRLRITGQVAPDLSHDIVLSLHVNQETVAQKTLSIGERFTWDIPLSIPKEKPITLTFTSNHVFYDHGIGPANDGRPLAVSSAIVSLRGDNPSSMVSVTVVQPYCYGDHGHTICSINLPSHVDSLQLPVLYYPHLLAVTVNDQRVPYYPSLNTNMILTAIHITPGKHAYIDIHFRGLQWANWISAAAWFILLLWFILRRVMLRQKVQR